MNKVYKFFDYLIESVMGGMPKRVKHENLNLRDSAKFSIAQQKRALEKKLLRKGFGRPLAKLTVAEHFAQSNPN
jgi:hypothetical protein